MSFWIDEGMKFFNDSFSVEFDCSDFGDSVAMRVESGGFEVEYDIMFGHGFYGKNEVLFENC